MSKSPLLVANGLCTYYGHSQALFNVSLSIPSVGGVAILGRNGAGKTTLLKTIADSESILKITQRLESLERLRQTLETNASEPLALEVGFLKTFG